MKRFTVIFLFFLTSTASAADFGKYFLIGECVATVNPVLADWSDLYPRLCLKGHAEASGAISSGEPRILEAYGSKGTASLFLGRWLSVGASGENRLIRAKDPKVNEFTKKLNFFNGQIGSNGIDRHRISFGRMPLPFGLNKRNMSTLYDSFQNQAYWDFQDRVIEYTYDNFLDTTFQVAVGNNGASDNQSIAVRYMFDLSALEGSRVIFSTLANELGERRVSLAYYNHNSLGDEIHGEWVRGFNIKEELQNPFRQVLLIGYRSKVRDDGRWRALIEDELKMHRLGVVEYDYPIVPKFFLSPGVGYLKSENELVMTRWYFTTGVQGEI